jgi:hypothetical protein
MPTSSASGLKLLRLHHHLTGLMTVSCVFYIAFSPDYIASVCNESGMRREAAAGKKPHLWMVGHGYVCLLLFAACCSSVVETAGWLTLCLCLQPQLGGGPRPVNDSWEHMWWDNLHWKRCVGLGLWCTGRGTVKSAWVR